MRCQRLLERIQVGKIRNVAFDDFVELVEDLGFYLERIYRRHRVYLHPIVARPFSVQPEKGKVRPHQTRQLLRLVEEFGLPRKE